MKRIDFEYGTVTGNILGAALPMLVAQILSLLYNIVDRVYIARIPDVGTAALGAVGLCFPLIVAADWVKQNAREGENILVTAIGVGGVSLLYLSLYLYLFL